MKARAANVRIGIAIGGGGITSVLRRGDAVHVEHVPSAPDAPLDANGALDAAFARIAAQLGAALGHEPTGALLDIALLPPHADARLVPLPPLGRTEAEAVLRRDAARHFVGGAGARVVAVRMPHALGRRRADAAPVMAVAAPAAFVDAVRAAAQGAGFRVRRFTSGHAAWIAAASHSAKRAVAGAPFCTVAVDGDVAHVIRVERDAVTVLRRMPAGDVAGIVAALGSGPGAACGFAEAGAALAAALGAADWTVVRGPAAAQAAAAHADGAAMELVPDTALLERAAGRRTLARRLAAATFVLLAGAAVVHVWGAQRELDAVQRERAAIRADVAPLLEVRDSLDRLRERADMLRSLSASPQWTRALFDIAMLLPPDAHVLSLRGTGDTLVIAAEGARAGAALQALRSAASLRNVALQGTVERDLHDGATTRERFTLHARLAQTADTLRGRTGAAGNGRSP